MWLKFSTRFATVMVKSAPALAFLVGTIYVVRVLLNYKNDTTRITNAAFGITAVLASLSFSCARALGEKDNDRDRFTYAGERFMHACIFLILASVLKYTMLTLQATGFGQAHITSSAILLIPLNIVVASMFWQALHSSHTGLKVCGDLLLPRLHRYDGYYKLF